jgi:molybdate transport system regulatory protein
MNTNKDLKIRLKIELPGGVRLGYGKIDLLRAVDREQSISAAARAMGMSYRRAWLLIDELNRSFAFPVIETRVGGKAHGGAELTVMGKKIIVLYERAEDQANAALQSTLSDIAVHLDYSEKDSETSDEN